MALNSHKILKQYVWKVVVAASVRPCTPRGVGLLKCYFSLYVTFSENKTAGVYSVNTVVHSLPSSNTTSSRVIHCSVATVTKSTFFKINFLFVNESNAKSTMNIMYGSFKTNFYQNFQMWNHFVCQLKWIVFFFSIFVANNCNWFSSNIQYQYSLIIITIFYTA